LQAVTDTNTDTGGQGSDFGPTPARQGTDRVPVDTNSGRCAGDTIGLSMGSLVAGPPLRCPVSQWCTADRRTNRIST
jgi:hypothetical protein